MATSDSTDPPSYGSITFSGAPIFFDNPHPLGLLIGGRHSEGCFQAECRRSHRKLWDAQTWRYYGRFHYSEIGDGQWELEL